MCNFACSNFSKDVANGFRHFLGIDIWVLSLMIFHNFLENGRVDVDNYGRAIRVMGRPQREVPWLFEFVGAGEPEARNINRSITLDGLTRPAGRGSPPEYFYNLASFTPRTVALRGCFTRDLDFHLARGCIKTPFILFCLYKYLHPPTVSELVL